VPAYHTKVVAQRLQVYCRFYGAGQFFLLKQLLRTFKKNRFDVLPVMRSNTRFVAPAALLVKTFNHNFDNDEWQRRCFAIAPGTPIRHARYRQHLPPTAAKIPVWKGVRGMTQARMKLWYNSASVLLAQHRTVKIFI
jgi:hypothetical protein